MKCRSGEGEEEEKTGLFEHSVRLEAVHYTSGEKIITCLFQPAEPEPAKKGSLETHKID